MTTKEAVEIAKNVIKGNILNQVRAKRGEMRGEGMNDQLHPLFKDICNSYIAIKSVQCINCQQETYCKIHEEVCDGYMKDCPDYELAQTQVRAKRGVGR